MWVSELILGIVNLCGLLECMELVGVPNLVSTRVMMSARMYVGLVEF